MSETKRPPGRPRLADDDDTISVSVRMPTRLYDQTCELAERQRMNVPETIRRALRRAAEDDDD